MMTQESQNYYRPANIDEAVDLKKSMPKAVFLSGGTQVNRAPLGRVLPETLIDLRQALNADIRVENTAVVIGAFSTLQDIADAENVPEALRMAASFIPTRSVRNQATIGGNIAAGRNDSYLIPALIALCAQLTVPGSTMSVEEYVLKRCDELILDIHISDSAEPCVAVKESRSHLALPVVSAAVSLKRSEKGGIAQARVVAGCVAPKVIRLNTVEEALVADKLKDLSELEAAIHESVDPVPNILGSAEYKKYINSVVIADAVMQCREKLS